jgi:hypothetical protein
MRRFIIFFLFFVIPQRIEKAFPEIPPALPFSKGGELFGENDGRLPVSYYFAETSLPTVK